LTGIPVYIIGTGIISALGEGLAATEQLLRENRSAIKPLKLFPLEQGSPLPVGQAPALDENAPLPRTHRLALSAARQAMAGVHSPPDAIILGTTTGGILTTEELLKRHVVQKKQYRYHGLVTVADCLARELCCTGPALVVSTACSSGVVALSLALKMLRSGQAETVLAGSVDSLSRLTYFGFHSLQLIDRAGCRPLDCHRQGMSVAEGAGILLLTSKRQDNFQAVLLGAGLSCDAYHPAAPHPEGQGAFMAMQNGLADSGLKPEDIGYINLHGTGTPDNDLAESKALRRLFTSLPPLSSIKGATGHSLAAAGAIEAVVATIAVARGLLPANTGLAEVDPALGLNPLTRPTSRPVPAVLSNSFGFGGNNGSLIIGAVDIFPTPTIPPPPRAPLAIHGFSCITGAGDTAATIAMIRTGETVAGKAGLETVSASLPPRLIRRLKRLPRMTLSLAAAALDSSAPDYRKPAAVYMGTGWGALSETHDFLTRLADSNEQFPSPTDFVGSVHNGPASQVAILLGATGNNITTSGGDYSFEQALLAADLMLENSAGPALVLGVDEGHEIFSPLLDPSISPGTTLADGGGAFCITRHSQNADCLISIPFYQNGEDDGAVTALIAALAEELVDGGSYAAILAGIPAAMYEKGIKQLNQFISLAKPSAPIIHYRRFTGEFASASAVAAVLAASMLESGTIPGGLTGGSDIAVATHTNRILVLGFGQQLTAMEFFRP